MSGLFHFLRVPREAQCVKRIGIFTLTRILWCRRLEGLLDYEFRDVKLLKEACTHCSWPDQSAACYQRLEFLGDAALDLLISRYYIMGYRYETFQNMPQDPCKFFLLTLRRNWSNNSSCPGHRISIGSIKENLIKSKYNMVGLKNGENFLVLLVNLSYFSPLNLHKHWLQGPKISQRLPSHD